MFQFARSILLFGLLVSTLTAADENTLNDLKSDVEALEEEDIEDVGTKIERQLNAAACPFGFTYLPAAKSCYQVVYESHDWYSAGVRCQKLQDGAHTVAINSAEENEALKTFLAYQMPNHPACIPREHKTKGGFFWTSGQRRDESKCGFQKYNPFVWKLPGGRRQEFGFKNWRPLEPNCELFKEHCMVIWPAKSYGWNDERCSMKVCPLCEYNP